MRKIVLAMLVVCLSLPVFAQQSAPPTKAADAPLPADAPTRAQVMTLLELMQARKAMKTMMDNMKQIMKQAAEERFRKKVPNPTTKQLEALRGIYDDILDASPDDMIDAIISIYQRHFSTTDLEELIRFYSSPVGQKMLREQPQIVQESMRAGAEIEKKRMGEIEIKINQRIQDLAEASDESNTTPKK